jgi:hypothetical protein
MIDELQFITGLRIEPVLVSEDMLQKAIDTCYPLGGKSDTVALVENSVPVPAEPAKQAVVEEEDSVFQSLLNDFVNSADPQEVKPLGQRFQLLLNILQERGILSIREFDRLKNKERSELG